MRADDLIAAKRDGKVHDPDDLLKLIDMVVSGEMRDEQVGAWLMAAYLNGLTDDELCPLTMAMAASGTRVDLSGIEGPVLDKHSTGGVGDKATLIVAPILAAVGVGMLKMSGRGLGFSGGTIDKLEAIPGFRTNLTVDEAREQVRRIGLAIVGQSPGLVPADKRLYAIRDVTATVDCIPLIVSSIISKKLAGGAHNVLLDVKAGRGSFMRTRSRARELAASLVRMGEALGMRTVAMITDMEEPLGRCVGNALEVREAIEVLRGDPACDKRLVDLCRALSARALEMLRFDPAEAEKAIARVLADGSAARKLALLIEAQGGDPRVVDQPDRLPQAPVLHTVCAGKAGFVRGIDAEKIGRAAVEMGAGRRMKEHSIDPAVGLVLRKKAGDPVAVGEPLADLHLRTDTGIEWYEHRVLASYHIGPTPPQPRPVVLEVVEG